MYPSGWDAHFGMGWGGGWFMILFWIAVMLVVVALWRGLWVKAARGEDGVRRKALEILEERYARGEIDAAEYDEKRRHLG